MKLCNLSRGVRIGFVISAIASVAPQVQAADSGCRTGGSALADAYVLANPIYAHFFGELEPYVANNVNHFRAGGDSIRCASALSGAFLSSAIQVYDPNDLRRQQELNARLGTLGISPGPQQPTLSSQLYAVSMQLSRLARVLPAAAGGDYGPLYTPTNELEQMQMYATQMFRVIMQDPSMAAVMAQMAPLFREAAQLDHQIIRQAAERMANAE